MKGPKKIEGIGCLGTMGLLFGALFERVVIYEHSWLSIQGTCVYYLIVLSLFYECMFYNEQVEWWYRRQEKKEEERLLAALQLEKYLVTEAVIILLKVREKNLKLNENTSKGFDDEAAISIGEDWLYARLFSNGKMRIRATPIIVQKLREELYYRRIDEEEIEYEPVSNQNEVLPLRAKHLIINQQT